MSGSKEQRERPEVGRTRMDERERRGDPAGPRRGPALWQEIKARRLFPIVGSYAAAGWIAMEVMGALVARDALPEILFQVGMIWYLGGLPAAAVIAWFHGERGDQRAPRAEIVFVGALAVVVFGLSGFSVAEYRTATLARSAAASGALDVNRIAVMYFRDGGGTGEHQYLAEALTEQLIAELARVRALDVVSRKAVEPFRDGEVAPDSVAQLLKAGTVVTGSVERRGQRIRVDLRLIDGASGVEFRRTGFEHAADDVLGLGAQVGEQASRVLREWLGSEVRLRQSRRATEDVAAWSQFQRAEKRRKDGGALVRSGDVVGAGAAFAEADELAEKAAELDPRWPEPAVLRAVVAYQRALLDQDPHSRWIEEALELAGRAVGLDPSHAGAREVRGSVRYWRYHMAAGLSHEERRALLESARADLEEAVRLDPTLASAYATLSNVYYEVPDVSSALLAGRRAYEEDAYLDNAALILSRLFFGSIDLEQFGEATRWCREGAQRFPEDTRFAFCEVLLMGTPALPPDIDRSWALVRAVDSLAPAGRRDFERMRATVHTATVIARAGQPDSARAVLRRAEAEIPSADPTQGLFAAAAYPYIVLRDMDRAIDSYKRYLLVNPSHAFKPDREIGWWWRPLQDHPRFGELLAR